MSSLIVLLGILSLSFCKDGLYISKEKSLWSNESDDCILATPKLNTPDNSKYRLTDNIDIDLPLNESIWTGYYQVVRTFEYIGCVSKKEVLENENPSKSVAINREPSHCFPGCGNDTFIGVTLFKCYCLGSEFNSTYQLKHECSFKCGTPLVACGGTSVLSIYKINHDVRASAIPGALEGRDCLAMDPGAQKFIWENCIESFSLICTDGNLIPPLRTNKYPWVFAVGRCFEQNMVPTLFSNSKNADKYINSKIWTGMFKTKVVYKVSTEVPEGVTVEKKSFGYLKRDSENSMILQFTDVESSHRKLCFQGKHRTEETTHSSTTLNTTTHVAKDNDKSEKTTFSTIAFPTTNMAEDIKSSVIFIAKGVGASLAAIALFTVILICLVNRELKRNVLSQVYYLSPTYLETIHGNNFTRSDEDMASEHYATAAETTHQHIQSMKHAAAGSDKSMEFTKYQKIEEELKLDAHIYAEMYETLQDIKAEQNDGMTYDSLS